MGAALFFNGALMYVAGIQIVVSRPITLRATLIIGLSVLAAMAVLIFPGFFRALPSWLQPITGSEITVAVIISVALNALFLLGTWRVGEVRLGAEGTPLTAAGFDQFFAKQVADWKIPPDDARRVQAVVDEAIDRVSLAAHGPVTVRVGSDEFEVSVVLSYLGNLPNLPDVRPRPELVEEQSFVSGLSGYLSGLHADRIERSARGEECEIKLGFQL